MQLNLKYDEADAKFVESHTWCLTAGYTTTGLNGRTQYLHRLLLNAPPGSIIDHINGDKLDARRSNLRFVTHAENLQNQKLRADNTTGVRGVSFELQTRRYLAQIVVNGRLIKRARFATLEEAEVAVKSWRAEFMPASVR